MEQTQENGLMLLIDSTVTEPETKKNLLTEFKTFFEMTQEWKEKAKSLVVTDASQIDLMVQAGEARKMLKQIRINTEKTRKRLKEDSLRRGQSIDAIARLITNEIVPAEKHLEEQEKFIEIQEEKRLQALEEERASILSKYEFDTQFYDLKTMPDNVFNTLVLTAKTAHEERIAAEKRAAELEAERLRKEAEEKERLRIENERIKAEAEEKEKQFRAEKAALEAEFKKKQEAERLEREKQEKARREQAAKEAALKAEQEAILAREREERRMAEEKLKAKQEAEEKSKLEAEEAERKRLAAPDKDKLIKLANDFLNYKLPPVSSPRAIKALEDTTELLKKISTFLKQRAEDL